MNNRPMMRWMPLLLFASSLIAQDTLVVGSRFVQPPMAYYRRHKPTGFEVDLLKALASKLDSDLQFVSMSKSELEEAWQEGRCDVLIGECADDSPDAQLDYLKTYWVILEDDQHKSPQGQLDNRPMGCLDKKEALQIAQNYGPIKVYAADQMLEALSDLTSGKIQGLVHLELHACYLKFAKGSLSIHRLSNWPQLPLSFKMQPKHHQSLKQAFDSLQSSEEYKNLIKRWFGFGFLKKDLNIS